LVRRPAALLRAIASLAADLRWQPDSQIPEHAMLDGLGSCEGLERGRRFVEGLLAAGAGKEAA